MKFVDLVKITVIAGNGGNGCISFKKKGKNNWLKKPDGSNGGDGGNVKLLTDTGINTLHYFCFNRVFRAQHGSRGRSNHCTGKRGSDLVIKVPQGTKVSCQETCKMLGDMVGDPHKKALIVAKGGRHGLGNRHYKYFTKSKYNKNLEKSRICGSPGEVRHLLLELILIADVGVFGLPNVGKSSFLSVVSHAKPKIANYPFTTLVPNLGTVQINHYNKFVIADIPGIIKGASKGLGLGIQFLKHLERCSMLLHFIDVNPVDNSDPIENILTIEQELRSYNAELMNKTRWLVFNKIDLLNKFELANKIHHIIQSVSWKDRYYIISVIKNINIIPLCHDIMQYLKYNDKDVINNIKQFQNNETYKIYNCDNINC